MVRDSRPGFSRVSEMSAPAQAWNVGPLDHWTTGQHFFRAAQGYAGSRQGGREAGIAAGTAGWTSQRVCLITTTWAGGRYRENYLQSLQVLIWKI